MQVFIEILANMTQVSNVTPWASCFSLLRHLNFQKPTSQQGKTNKRRGKNQPEVRTDIFELWLIMKLSHINGIELQSTNGFDIFYEGQNKLTIALINKISIYGKPYQFNEIVTKFKLNFQTI
jgi:hypothetical protein